MTYNPASEAKFIFELLDLDIIFSVISFDVTEAVSDTYVVNLTLASKDSITFEDIKFQEGVLTVLGGVGAVQNDNSGDRYFHGIIRKFKHSGASGKSQIYEAQMVPSLWLLSLEERCRIFQDKPLKEIIATLLDERDITSDMYELRLARDDIFVKFSIQYQETNLNYLSRLLEHEGIFYFFEHFKYKHVLVFCDTEAFYREICGEPEVTYNSNGLVAERENIFEFDFSERLRPGTLSQKNFNFKTPSVNLTTKNEIEKEKNFEVYEYPGPYGETGRGSTMSKIRLEEIQVLAKRGFGHSCCPRLQPGATFTLTDHPQVTFNDEYFVYSVTHNGEQPQVLQEHASGGSASYSNIFMVIPSSVTYRPEQWHQKPMVPGLLSAIVTGPKGEEIWPDEYGRVNVQFHFDREGKMDEKSSCWLRTVQFWNGTTWGSQFIPRIGDEVLVSFINGDMDYPVIIGSVPNAAKPPNYNLPANKTQSGIRTRSTPGGNPDNYNELRFEDKIGHEEIYLQGEKDWNILIKNDKGQYVGHDETLNVRNNRTKTVGVDQSETIGANKTINVGANHVETIGSNMILSVGNCKTEFVGINTAETIGAAKELSVGAAYAVTVGGAMNTAVGLGQFEEVGLIKKILVGKRFDISAGDKIEIICGKSQFSMDKEGNIILRGSNIDISTSGNITLKGRKVSTNG